MMVPEADCYLFGSRTDDTLKSGDIDLLLLTPEKLPPHPAFQFEKVDFESDRRTKARSCQFHHHQQSSLQKDRPGKCHRVMNPANSTALLESNRQILGQALPSFIRSIEKCRTFDFETPISFEVEESFDALTSKFSRVSDIFTQKVLKSFLILLREDAPTFLDRMNLCEKLGIIPSADDLIAIRDLINLIAHEYLTENLLRFTKKVSTSL